MEYSKLANGQVTSLGGSTPVILPYAPSYIWIFNSTRATAASGVTVAEWSYDMGQGAAKVTTTSAGPADGTSYITATTGTGFTTFSANLQFQYGSTLNVASISQANPAVVTTASNHGLVTGDVVIFQLLNQSATTGMQQICNIPFAVTVTGATTFTIPWNTNQSNYTAYASGAATSQATVKKVLYPSLYYPGVQVISSITTGSTTTVVTTSPHNYVVGQEVSFRISSAWGTTQLNSLPNSSIPGSPIYGFVTSIPNSTTVVVNINSTGYTAFNTNIPVASVRGLTPAQIVAVGDNNTGSLLFGYNSNTINGPTISGAFLNNTNQGFVIGSAIAGTAGDIIYWRAYYHDLIL